MKKRLTLTLNQELSKNLVKTKAEALVVGVNEGRVLNSISASIDDATNGAIKKLIKRGELRVDFYNNKKKYLFSKILKKNDLIILNEGAHGFKVKKTLEMIEVKQGPYKLSKDKVRFKKIDENKIKIKK